MTVLTASFASKSRTWRLLLPGLAAFLMLWGCGQPQTGLAVKDDPPLILAEMNNHKDEVAGLLAQGADVNVKDDRFGNTPLHWAAFMGRKEMVDLLLAHGADVNSRNKDGRTPLHEAAQMDTRDVVTHHLEVAELLIAKGADVNAQDKGGNTPLVLAGTAEMALLLIDKGANVKTSCLPLIYAAEHGWTEVVKELIAKGAVVTAKTESGFTALHSASTKEIAEILLAHGADVNAKDVAGETPLHMAASLEVKNVLLAHGAVPWTPVKDMSGERRAFLRNNVALALVEELNLADSEEQLGQIRPKIMPTVEKMTDFMEKLDAFDGTVAEARKRAHEAAQSQGITDPVALNQAEMAAEQKVRSDFPAAFERDLKEVVAALEKLRPILDADQVGKLDKVIRETTDSKKEIEARVAGGGSPLTE